MPIAEIVTFCPQAKPLLAEYGLHCFHCTGSAIETLDDGCRSHGFDDTEIDALVTDLNELLTAQPTKPQTLTVTADAARAIKRVADDEHRTGEGLSVIVDGTGGFCMEFRPDALDDEQTFRNDTVPDVRIFASTLTLSRIGGSTIDFREGRFKLDLPAEDRENHACVCNGNCNCSKK